MIFNIYIFTKHNTVITEMERKRESTTESKSELNTKSTGNKQNNVSVHIHNRQLYQ